MGRREYGKEGIWEGGKMGIYSFESHFSGKKNFVETELENADY